MKEEDHVQEKDNIQENQIIKKKNIILRVIGVKKKRKKNCKVVPREVFHLVHLGFEIALIKLIKKT